MTEIQFRNETGNEWLMKQRSSHPPSAIFSQIQPQFNQTKWIQTDDAISLEWIELIEWLELRLNGWWMADGIPGLIAAFVSFNQLNLNFISSNFNQIADVSNWISIYEWNKIDWLMKLAASIQLQPPSSALRLKKLLAWLINSFIPVY